MTVVKKTFMAHGKRNGFLWAFVVSNEKTSLSENSNDTTGLGELVSLEILGKHKQGFT